MVSEESSADSFIDLCYGSSYGLLSMEFPLSGVFKLSGDYNYIILLFFQLILLKNYNLAWILPLNMSGSYSIYIDLSTFVVIKTIAYAISIA